MDAGCAEHEASASVSQITSEHTSVQLAAAPLAQRFAQWGSGGPMAWRPGVAGVAGLALAAVSIWLWRRRRRSVLRPRKEAESGRSVPSITVVQPADDQGRPRSTGCW